MRKAIQHLQSSDPVLGAVIDRVGPYRIEYREPAFETLVRSIVYQQLSGKAASTILARLLAACRGGRVTPGAILRMSTEDMRGLGLSKQKASYLSDLAERTRARRLVFARLPECSDEQVIEKLTQVKGVGVWTAHMFLIFALRRPDILPVGDLGVRSAIKKLYGLGEMPSPARVEEIAAPWRPYCSVASWYLWRSLDNEAAI